MTPKAPDLASRLELYVGTDLRCPHQLAAGWRLRHRSRIGVGLALTGGLDPSAMRPRMAAICVRRAKAALSSGCKSHPANAPAGSNRSSHGGDEMAEAFGVAGHI